ncbi:Ankyrin repeat domain-containing protein 50 [Cladobotryum mycophilum]|uniref:Ankyrin repeat domain-containing protein 50 n=1 Tax=Cladobotryum mycophilum TaxID=491253 RepID=A0ABR0S8K7_9HYPO
MSEYHIRQQHIIGVAQGVNNGDNFITYNYLNDTNGANALLPLKQASERLHKEVKAHWENSGTCAWLPQRPDFKTWVSMKNSYSFLWIHGIQGCGKTTLMSRVIESIRDERITGKGPNAIHLLYFYIGYGKDEQEGKLYKEMLMTFWEQAVRTGEAQSSNVFGSQSSNEVIQKQLSQFLATSLRDVYIVVDALDQLHQNDRRDLLKWLNDLVREHKQQENGLRLAVVISSRDCIGYEKLREYDPLQIQITPSDNTSDIRTYLEKTLDSDLFDEEPRLRERVLSELIKEADGMFLWAKLQAANICDISIERDVIYVLDNLILPTEMDEIYRKYVTEFESLKPWSTEKQVVMRTMALLAQTTGSMPKETMLAAITIDLNDGKPHPTTLKDFCEAPSKVVRFCKHLIDINESLGTVRFCHVSIFEFFKSRNPIGDHALIAELCLAHLCSSDFSQGPQSNVTWYNHGSLGPILRQHPFVEFASCNWASSMKKSVERNTGVDAEQTHVKILGLLERLLTTTGIPGEQKNLQLSFQVHLLTRGISMPAGVHHEHIFSYFALLEFFDFFNKKGWLHLTRRDHEGSMVIHWAIRHKDEREEKKKEIAKVVEMLINYGGDKDAQNNEGRTPLYYASYYGNSHVVGLLLDKRAKLDIPTNENETALIIACRKHHEEIILRLVAAGADIGVQGPVGTALQAISLIGCDSCAKRILDQYGTQPIIETKGPFGTSLHAAAFHGHSDIVRLLCERKFDVHATNETYGSALTAAAHGCNTGMDMSCFRDIFHELIDHGINVNDPSGLGGPALRAAAHHGHIDLVQLLLEAGAEVRLAKGFMGTAYEAADVRGHEEITKLLLKSDPNAATYGEKDSKKAFYTINQRLQREVFGVTVRASNMAIITSLIEQFEKLFEKEINKGNTPWLRGLVKLGENCFIDVMHFATVMNPKPEAQKEEEEIPNGKTGEREEGEHGALRKQAQETSKRNKTLLQRIMTSLCCISAIDEETETPNRAILVPLPESSPSRPPVAPTLQEPESTPVQQQPTAKSGSINKRSTSLLRVARRTSSLEFLFVKRQSSTTYGQDNLEGHFPQVLDRLTQAAVNILEFAIEKGDPEVIRIISEAWTSTLNNLIAYEGFGEPMLERVIQGRSTELKKHLTNKELKSDERFRKAENLARVGAELLFTTVRRGPPYRRLTLVLSKFWMSAVCDVENLGELGQEPVARLISTFTENFSEPIKAQDHIKAELSGTSALELLKAAAVGPNKRVTIKSCEELVRQWRQAAENEMGALVVGLFDSKWGEYQKCIINKGYDEALSLAVAGLCLLQVAIEQRFDVTIRWLLNTINLGFRWTIAPGTVEEEEKRLGQNPNSDIDPGGERSGLVFDNMVSLFATTEGGDPYNLYNLALTILDVAEALPKESQQTLMEMIQQRIKHARRGVHAAELELQLRQISITTHYFLAVAQNDNNEARPNTISALKELAQTVPRVKGNQCLEGRIVEISSG